MSKLERLENDQTWGEKAGTKNPFYFGQIISKENLFCLLLNYFIINSLQKILYFKSFVN